MTRKISPPTPVNSGRHAAECKICAHPQRDEIERDFVNWRSPASITKQYGLRNRSTVYRTPTLSDFFLSDNVTSGRRWRTSLSEPPKSKLMCRWKERQCALRRIRN